jgi:large subunit ribosomal protein L10
MAKTKKEKNEILENYANKLKKSNSFFIISPTKITSNEANTLRKQLKESKASFQYIANRIFKKALEKTNIKLEDIDFKKENVITFCEGDISSSIKVVNNFLEESKKGVFKGGLLDNKFLTVEDLKTLAELPSKENMISITVRTISAPLQNIIYVLNGNILNLINVLKNLSEKK